MPEAVRVGVIGTGVGVAHIESLRSISDVVVTGICSAQRARAAAVAAQHGVPFATDDYRALLTGPADAVVITAPPALHAPMALAACAAGKHVLCEKPLAATLPEARAMAEAAHAAGIIRMVNHQTRQSPPIRRAGELIKAGYLGRTTVADIVLYYNPAIISAPTTAVPARHRGIPTRGKRAARSSPPPAPISSTPARPCSDRSAQSRRSLPSRDRTFPRALTVLPRTPSSCSRDFRAVRSGRSGRCRWRTMPIAMRSNCTAQPGAWSLVPGP